MAVWLKIELGVSQRRKRNTLTQQDETRLTSEDIGCFKRGCLIALALAVLLFFYRQHAYVLLKPNVENSAKWSAQSIFSYRMTVGITALIPFQGESLITVHGGRIVAGTNPMCPTCKPSAYQSYTIGSLFGRAWSCSLFFPWLQCSITYDAQYGYPSEIIVDCPIPDACYEDIRVVDISPIP